MEQILTGDTPVEKHAKTLQQGKSESNKKHKVITAYIWPLTPAFPIASQSYWAEVSHITHGVNKGKGRVKMEASVGEELSPSADNARGQILPGDIQGSDHKFPGSLKDQRGSKWRKVPSWETSLHTFNNLQLSFAPHPAMLSSTSLLSCQQNFCGNKSPAQLRSVPERRDSPQTLQSGLACSHTLDRPGPVRIKTPVSDKHLSFADLRIFKRRLLQIVHSNCRTHWRPLEQAIEVRELEGTNGMKGLPLLYYNLPFLMGGDVLLRGTLKKKANFNTCAGKSRGHKRCWKEKILDLWFTGREPGMETAKQGVSLDRKSETTD